MRQYDIFINSLSVFSQNEIFFSVSLQVKKEHFIFYIIAPNKMFITPLFSDWKTS